ncbi:hypothetical protein SNE40_018404 [Patella caerulea]|uniref:TATA box-binding protein-like 1 n=1 Tax=Patella caerulea TaxID=87958 RepID=A0AAN8J9I9_PATCE
MAAAEGMIAQPNELLSKTEPVDELLTATTQNEEQDSYCDDEPVLEININNVVCSFNTRCHLNLRRIALEGSNVEFKKENGMCNMKIRSPKVTASIWSSGKITCTGATSEEDSKIAGRRVARRLQQLGFNVRFTNFRVVNVLGTCSLPFGIKITLFSRRYTQQASYEPELHPGVTYRIKEPKATLKIFSTGSITVTAPSVYNVQCAIEHIYPLVCEFKAEGEVDRKTLLAEKKYLQNQGLANPNKIQRSVAVNDEEEGMDSDEDESFDSDASHD